MVGIQRKSVVVFDSIVMRARQLKWAWDYLLHLSFAFPNGSFEDDLLGRSGDHHECAVCLCRIDEEDEVAEIRCNHLFHRVCLDRWVGFGHITCPLCRDNIRLAPFVQAEQLFQEIIQIRFSATGTGHADDGTWWLR
ncbi:putative RING-H2 finger protein ATL50 [Henckelia pumila]|uniref:putative RING-H2 finger protein ATL50 n=1 Tax=Henckelia pumila TaxID=405737 RepID=UPI003C6E2255